MAWKGGATISGTVTGADGALLAGVLVRVEATDSDDREDEEDGAAGRAVGARCLGECAAPGLTGGWEGGTRLVPATSPSVTDGSGAARRRFPAGSPGGGWD